MASKIQVGDIAGVFVRLIDKSRVVTNTAAPFVLRGAFAVESERGFINQVHTVSENWETVFGNKNWRRYGFSLYDMDRFIGSGNPMTAYATRVGNPTSTLAGATFNEVQQQGGYGFLTTRGILWEDFLKTIEEPKTGVVVEANSDGTNSVIFTDFVLDDGQFIEIWLWEKVEIPSIDPDADLEIEEKLVSHKYKFLSTHNDFVDGFCERADITEIGLNFTTELIPETGKNQARVNGILKIKEDPEDPSSPVRDLELGEEIVLPMGVNNRPEMFIFSKLPSGHFLTWEDRPGGKGFRQDEIELFTGGPGQICHFFARGEGEWGNNITITIANRQPRFRFEGPDNEILYDDVTGNIRAARPSDFDGDETINAGWFQAFSETEEDGPRIFSITIFENGIQSEHYPFVSFNPKDRNGSGHSIYIEDVLANDPLVAVVVNMDADLDNIVVAPVGNPTNPSFSETIRLTGGKYDYFPRWNDADADGMRVRENAFQRGLQTIFNNPVKYDVPLTVNAGQEIPNRTFNGMVDSYKRTFGLTGCPRSEAFSPVVPNTSGGVTSKYVAKYNQWIQEHDRSTQQNIFTPPQGWIAELIANQFRNNVLPKATAGYNRARLTENGALALSRTWTPAQRLELDKFQWNSIKDEPSGITVWQSYTSQTFKSALSNIHVMISFMVMMRGIESILRGFEFEDNDEVTIAIILNLLRGLANDYLANNYAHEILVNANDNRIGTEQIRINWDVRFREAARTIVVDVNVHPSSQELSVSIRE
jgi:hypothetical protein